MEKILDVLKSVLTLLGTITVPAMEKFVDTNNFRPGQAGITYLNVGESLFWKISENTPAESLAYHQLKEASSDVNILAELGRKAATTFSCIFHLLTLQANGESGALLTNNIPNIFYVRDVIGQFHAVSVRWIGTGWSVFSYWVPLETNPEYIVPHRGKWLEDARVFSSNHA